MDGKAINRADVLWEPYPGAANEIEAQAPYGWCCEEHPDREAHHDDCAAPGMPRERPPEAIG